MDEIPARPVLLTGASGALGRVLAKELGAAGWPLRLTDIRPFPDPLPAGAGFTRADLADGMAILRLAENCGTILHFGGVSVERPFAEVLGPNIQGLYHVYEAARRERARVVFASSNHAIGFHERSERLDHDCQFRPDGYYGVSKAYGELLGRLYWDKHGVENVNLRIGGCRPKVNNARTLAIWLSYADLVRLVMQATLAPAVGTLVIWGASNNARGFWGRDGRAVIGWAPEDSADPFIPGQQGNVSGNPVEERYQGGPYCAIDYTRTEPSPKTLFPAA
ncbi:MAG: NAD(P)-dependent oxidoreductase [Rhodospirillales bacterium]|nr:NAD(P)-dependent oxidoreductase [Rhodospirillales bacterium]